MVRALSNTIWCKTTATFYDIYVSKPTAENIILFKIVYQGQVTEIRAYSNQYYSLMTLISDQLAIPGFGLCCSMGSCGTCLVQISNSYHHGVKNMLACDLPTAVLNLIYRISH